MATQQQAIVGKTPWGGDPYFRNVSLLLHMDGTNGSTTIIDNASTPSQFITQGNAAESTTQVKFGTTSLGLDGTGDWIQSTTNLSAGALGSGDFTVEAWVYPNAVGKLIYDYGYVTGSAGRGWELWITGGSKLEFWRNVGVVVTSSTNVATGQWSHVAAVRNAGVITLYINGVASGSAANTSTYSTSGVATFAIGAQVQQRNATYDWNGYIDDCRITIGVARYTANFTPPTAAYPNYATLYNYTDQYLGYVSLLLHFDGPGSGTTFQDNSLFARQPSTISGPTLSTAQKKWGVTSLYLPATSANQLRYASSSDFNISGINFTLELWFYQTGGANSLICRRDPGVAGFTSGWVLTSSSIRANINGVWSDTQITWTGPALNTWNHIAWVVSGTTMSVYLNGILAGTKTSVTSINDTAATLDVGQSASGGENLFQGYIDDIRFTKGIARYTANFIPGVPTTSSVSLDPYYNNVSILLHFDGANDSTTFTDNSPNPKTVIRSTGTTASISTAQFKFGGASYKGRTEPDTSYITATLGTDGSMTGDFTLEFWLYNTSNEVILYSTTGGGYLYNNSFQSYGGPNLAINTYGAAGWKHLAITRSGSTMRSFVDGIQQDTQTYSGTVNLQTLELGRYIPNNNLYFSGYIDDLRITKGIARYTANFIPPTQAFPNGGQAPAPWANLVPPDVDLYYQYVSLLLHMDGSNASTSFPDNSRSPKTITANGGAQISTAQSKFGGSSAVFDGSGDRLVGPVSGIIDFAANDFTVEGWVYVLSYPDSQTTILSNYGTSGNIGFDVRVPNNGSIGSRFSVNGIGDAFSVSSPVGVTLNTWHHFAVVRQGTSYTVYLNGVGGTSVNVGTNAVFAPPSQTVWIGGTPDTGTGLWWFNGYIDDLRITKGIARYTANFTPPGGPFPDQ